MGMPNFLIIGAAKSGTTSLYRYLQAHPQIFMASRKEPHFFAFENEKPSFRGPGQRVGRAAVTKKSTYLAMFSGVRGEVAVGEASPTYLYYPASAGRIRQHVPDMKLIAILRQPADRAYSQFLHMIREGREPIRDFAAALAREDARIAQNWAYGWHYAKLGYYHEQLARYFALFDKSRIEVLLYEDLDTRAAEAVRQIYRFLEVGETFVPDTSIRFNAADPVAATPPEGRDRRAPRTPAMRALARTLSRAWRRARGRTDGAETRGIGAEKPPFDPALRRALTESFRVDVLRLQDQIQRDISHRLE
jgi:hypothetical protein